MNNLDKLLSIASNPLNAHQPEKSELFAGSLGDLGIDLLEMLKKRNGFYAFESALHVFPTRSSGPEICLEDWNKQGLWRSFYQGLADHCFFFAEDVFGGQFCIRNNRIEVFEPETGAFEFMANDIDGWAEALLNDYEMLTGYPLAHEWQERYGQIPVGTRLLPKVPFFAGGEFVLSNLYPMNAVDGMKLRGEIASQIKDLPDGARIEIKFSD
jgi:hypothetical protein